MQSERATEGLGGLRWPLPLHAENTKVEMRGGRGKRRLQRDPVETIGMIPPAGLMVLHGLPETFGPSVVVGRRHFRRSWPPGVFRCCHNAENACLIFGREARNVADRALPRRLS